jgi:hypothetical protein
MLICYLLDGEGGGETDGTSENQKHRSQCCRNSTVNYVNIERSVRQVLVLVILLMMTCCFLETDGPDERFEKRGYKGNKQMELSDMLFAHTQERTRERERESSSSTIKTRR